MDTHEQRNQAGQVSTVSLPESTPPLQWLWREGQQEVWGGVLGVALEISRPSTT